MAEAEASRWRVEVPAAAVVLGVAGDVLLRALPWGVGAALWMVLLMAGSVLVAVRAGIRPLDGTRAWLGAAAIFFAAALAWRDAGFLRALNVLAFLLAMGLAVARTRGPSIAQAGIADLAGDVLRVGAGAAFGAAPMLFGGLRWRTEGRETWKAVAVAGLRGLLMALPLLVIFGALLAAADPVFATLLERWLRVDLGKLVSHLLVAGALAWGVLGAFREQVAGRPWVPPAVVQARRPWLGPVEPGVALGLVNLLFLTFVIVQFRYLFGGASLVGVVSGFTHATYARRGFFELVAVTGLVLPVLLGTHWLVRPEDRLAQRIYRSLAWLTVGLVAVMMASALYRLWLYFDRYGLTTSRLYAGTFMLGLALVFAWFSATVLRGRRERFAVGALAVGLGVVLLLNFANPNGLVAKVNVGRAAEGHPLDAWYLAVLGADAAPFLLASLDALPAGPRETVASHLLVRWGDGGRRDWRTWNWARASARQAVRAQEDKLRAYLPR